ncbi:MAG: Nre family DNA repair protein [Sulfolobaceae archaeon]|uniref:Nre family DNA repair protein n=1 Tax=Stygiolobus sp. RP850M TaxID=3133137 RepID=UPI0028CCF485|nr:Nre family DNA repair protein [Sulfolobaceae archaeon]
MRKIPAELCIRCKGYKYLCGLPSCPIMDRFRSVTLAISKIHNSEVIEGSTPPSIIIGERGYPKVSLLYNIPPGVQGESAKDYEDPRGWWGKKSLNEILSLRSQMISSILKKIDITNPYRLYEKEISLAGVSYKPVDSNAVSDKKGIEPKLRFDGIFIPRGPSVEVNDIKVQDNPKLSPQFEKLIFDDVKAESAILELYRNGEDYYKIITGLSLGLFGLKKNRKLVPTRWSITAVDQAIGKFLLSQVKQYPEINEIEVYYSSYLGNYFHVIFFPSTYRSVWVEIWHPLSLWTKELIVSDLSENFWGEYDFLDGGYMASRLAVLEKLYERKRQAGVIIIREITSEYYAPVGNWHIRETTRRALEEKKIGTFYNLREAIKFVNSRLKAGNQIMLEEVRSIKKLLTQTTIDLFLDKK